MASLYRLKARGADGKPTWRILFYDGAGERRSVRLGDLPKKSAATWQYRVEQLNACKVSGTAIDTDLSAWVASLPDVSHEKLSQVGLVEPRQSLELTRITVAKLVKIFVERSSAKPATIRGFRQTLDSLEAYFGADTDITTITPEGADTWRAWIVGDKRGSGRRTKKRTTDDNRLAPPTVAKRVSVAKQVFRAAVRWEWITKSPFDALRPGSQANPARARYIPLETIRDVLDACPSVEWRLVVGLTRYAGLRCPTEVGELTWGDINWEKGRLTVRSTKTEHHGGDHAVRVVPLCPELRAMLAEAFDQAVTGSALVVPMASRKSVNLRTHLERIIARAGHDTWPRLLQNLRASCETDWVERYPSHVVAKWLGHSPKVAAAHYLMVRDHHFDDVVGGDHGGPPARTGKQSARCGAKWGAVGAQNGAPQASASGSEEPQKKTEPAATVEVAAGSAGTYADYQNRLDGGDRIRTCDLEVMSLASYRAAPPRDMFFAESESGSHPKRTMTIVSDPFRDVSPTSESE